MAWVAPTNVATGDVLTASAWNQAVVENVSILRALTNVQPAYVYTNTASYANTGTWGDISGMSVNITPTYSTSKVLVTVSVNVGASATNAGGFLRLVRGSTVLHSGTGATNNVTSLVYPGTTTNPGPYSIVYVDSPSATTATTYKVQWIAFSGTLYLNRPGVDGATATASSIIVQEIPV